MFEKNLLQQMREQGKNSIALRLMEDFPKEEGFIREQANIFLETIQKESRKLQLHHALPEEVEVSIEQFYTMKVEKQLRGAFRLILKKVFLQFIADIENTCRGIDRRGKLPKDSEKKSMVKNVAFERIDGDGYNMHIVASQTENEGEVKEYIWKRENLTSLKAGILSSLPDHELSKGQRTFLGSYEGDIQEISFAELIQIIRSNPALKENFKERFLNEVLNRKRFSVRKLRETFSILSLVLSENNPEDSLLDLCTGSGDLATVLGSSGRDISGVDLNERYLRVGDIYNRVLHKKGKKSSHLEKKDVINDTLPASEVWIAKHPCAPKLALPDEIIERFSRDGSAKKLYLLTCCANKSVGCCPAQYQESGIIDSDTWDNLCLNTSDIGVDNEEKLKKVQQSLREINIARIRYIQEQLGLEAELVEIEGSIMNQMIVMKKND